MSPTALAALAVLLLGLASCRSAELAASDEQNLATAEPALPDVPPPLELEKSAYETAATAVVLEKVPPTELPGLHNVYRLSENIVSGAEPHGEEALAALAAMGVRTILSVDGKAPDVETARRHGLRYVHVPIQYKGITTDELLAISKTFREAEGPFYVHCFHGQHRGPAAAAVGRVLLDGAPREQAIAEMRQWCGTSSKYEGLYKVVASGWLPPADQTASLELELPEQAPLEGIAGFMVLVSRPYDALKAMGEDGWKAPADHPDLDPVNEAAILAGLFRRASTMPELGEQADDFRAWMAESIPQATSLHEALKAARAAPTDDAWGAAGAALDRLSGTCNACHKAYRDN